MKHPNGMFLAVDGLDGSGKTLQASMLAERMTKWTGIEPVIIPSFSRNGFAGKIRKAMLGKDGERMNPLARQMFIASSYLHTYQTEVEPVLSSGGIVILDRCVPLSTVTYAVADGVHPGTMRHVAEIILRETRTPDLAFLLDVPYEVASERIGSREGQETNHFDLCPPQVFDLRRQYMLKAAEDYRRWCVILDGSPSITSVHEHLWSVWMDRIGYEGLPE